MKRNKIPKMSSKKKTSKGEISKRTKRKAKQQRKGPKGEFFCTTFLNFWNLKKSFLLKNAQEFFLIFLMDFINLLFYTFHFFFSFSKVLLFFSFFFLKAD